MATQLSSSDALPDHIIHCILGFLPRIKDVVKTSAISKSWLQAWRTFPIPEFNLRDFAPGSSSLSPEEFEAKTEQNFIGFVDSSLKRFGRQIGDGNGDTMKIFNLTTFSKMSHHTSRWIGMALDNKVEHLGLHIFSDGTLPCSIPDRILSAYWLKSLKLTGPTIYNPLTEGSRVNLPSLTSLRIESSDIPDDQLQKLLSGCPALEEIALVDCDSLSKIDIFKHPNLETLKFTVGFNTRADQVAIRVSAPKLKSFDYTCDEDCVCDVVVKIHNSPDLKSLRIGDKNKTDEWFHKFLAQFPLIEDLTIGGCNSMRKIRISNPHLEKISIFHCDSLKDVVISCKKLASFSLFTMYSSIPILSIRMEMDNLPNDCMAVISDPYTVWCGLLMEASWYCKLKEFLTMPFTCKSLIINECALDADDGDMTGKDLHKKLPSTACKIEKLSLNVNAPSSCHPHILNGLLSACHPTTIKLDITDNAFVKLVCEELGNRENNKMCLCKDDFKCWKHQLKEVKIEKIKGIKLEEDLDWDALFNLLPTLNYGNEVSFKLIWQQPPNQPQPVVQRSHLWNYSGG